MNPNDCMEAIHNIQKQELQAIRIVRVRVACCCFYGEKLKRGYKCMSEEVKECDKCMYCKKDNYCIRKEEKIVDSKICGHYVNAIESISMCKLIDEMLKVSN